MQLPQINFVILSTNYYVPLGIRLIKKIVKHYKGDFPLHFHVHSDKNPLDFLPQGTTNVSWIETKHTDWAEATNSKFKSILNLNLHNNDYVYYLDADTNVAADFLDEDILGDLVGAQHFNDSDPNKPYDRYEMSKAFIPRDTPLLQMYFQGAFFGGMVSSVKNFCIVLREWQIEDKKIPYEPGVNDESYINKYFHYHPPKVIYTKDFPFIISDKGGIVNQRCAEAAPDKTIADLIRLRYFPINVLNGQVEKE